MKIIGLTGGIASGKTTVARILAGFGASVIDADELAREVVEPGQPALAAVVGEFGAAVANPDGTLNRKALGDVVFNDQAARKKLEAILHPAIKSLAEARLTALRDADGCAGFYVAPLLIEAGITSRVDDIWVVYVDRETQLLRLVDRDGLSRAEAELRLAAQMSMEEKITYASVIIDNRGTVAETEDQVRRLWEELQAKAGH